MVAPCQHWCIRDIQLIPVRELEISEQVFEVFIPVSFIDKTYTVLPCIQNTISVSY